MNTNNAKQSEGNDGLSAKLAEFMKAEEIKGKIEYFPEGVESTQACIRTLGPNAKIIKTIIFVNETGQPIAVILEGKDRVNSGKLKKILSCKDLHLASEADIKSITGYELGGVPPFGYNCKFIIDDSLINCEEDIYAGGGSRKSLVKTCINEIIKHTDNIVLDVKK